MAKKTISRDRQRDLFLQAEGYEDWTCQLIAGDASFRKYYRLTKGGDSRILMDAPPPMEDIRPFVQITHLLNDFQQPLISAPTIFAENQAQGFLILSDLGSTDLKKALDKNLEREEALYLKAVDCLTALHRQQVTPLAAHYDQALYSRELDLFSDWYLPALFGGTSDSKAYKLLYQPLINRLLALTKKTVVTLRDYHAENIMVSEDQHLSLIDYQDAVMGHPAYDLVSLLQDARRLVSPALEQAALDHYLARYDGDADDFREAYALLGAQRSLKIIGIFTRLCLRDGKASYLKFLPHMWQMLDRNLSHPALAHIKDFLADLLPESVRQIVPEADRMRATFPIPASAMILAAGKGTRMGSLSDHTPKPLVTVAGKSLLSRILDHCFTAGVSQAVVNVHHLADQIEAACESRPNGPVITLSDERAALLETGGGVMKALPLINSDPFYVINSDALWVDVDQSPLLPSLAAAFDPDKMDILLAVLRVEDAPGYDGVGDLFLDEATGHVRLRGDAPTASHMFAGVRVMKKDCFDGETLSSWSMRRLFKKAAKAGRLHGLLYTGCWLHVGDPEALAFADQTITKLEGGR